MAPAFPARLGLAFRAKCTKELACSGLVEPGISRTLLHSLVPLAANNQGAVLAEGVVYLGLTFPPAQGPPESLPP